VISSPLRVLHVTDTLGMGGAETWMLELARRWAETGAVKMDFLATSGNKGLFDDEVAALGCRVFYLRYARNNITHFATGFRKLLGNAGYDAIHDHSDLAAGWHFLAGLGRLPRVRVAHAHNPLLHMRANYAVSFARKATASVGRTLTLRLATHVCGTSGQTLREYGFEPGRAKPAVSVLHCGFDIDRYNAPRDQDRLAVRHELGLPSEAKLILFVGRLDRDLAINSPRNHKNSWLAVLIARAAWKSDPDVRLVMAGAGDTQRTAMEAQIAKWGLNDQLRLLGVRRDIGRLMRAADVLLFPSAEEGLGMVAVEAQAAGLPVIASTAIPIEARVIAPLYRAVDLTEPPEVWAKAVLDTIAMKRPSLKECRAALEQSDFSVARSASRLEAIYDSGRK
jgi:glycosyltransferase involved in cell wall biosynthesis